MVIHEGLLRQARDCGSRMADAQLEVERAKADYHHAVRRLHYAGASMREIAEALEISHQRVHQIIEATGGSGGWKPTRGTMAELRCSFCGRSDQEVAKLVAGPKVLICNECVGLARRATDEGTAVESALTRLEPLPTRGDVPCSFCAKPAAEVSSMVTGQGRCLCGDCLDLCEEILATASEQ